jgi:hypothetical protein
MEYDCRKAQYRGLQFSMHSEVFANGRSLADIVPPDEWVHVAPGTHSAKLLNIVCGKK